MKSFPTDFSAQKNTAAGAKPVWFLTLNDGTTTYYISDRVVAAKNGAGADITTVAWVDSWGNLREGIINGIGEFSVGEYRVHLLNDPNNAANIIHIIDNHDIETNTACLYCWFQGITDPAELMFTGYVKDITLDPNDEGAELLLQDATVKSNQQVGIVATVALCGVGLDKSDTGKILPIVFGQGNKIPAIGVVSPAKTTLTSAITSGATTIAVADSSGFEDYVRVRIDSETILFTVSTPTSLAVVSRAWDGTTAAAHASGAVAICVEGSGASPTRTPGELTYVVAGHTITSFRRLWAKTSAGAYVEITANCTMYINGSFVIGGVTKSWASFTIQYSYLTAYLPGVYCDVTNSAADSPKEACDWLLANYGPPGITSITTDNSIQTTNGNLNGCILQRRSISYWLNRIAFEFRSRFKFTAAGTAVMLYRPDSYTSAKTVTNAMSRNIARTRGAHENIVNKIDLVYNRDWGNNSEDPYLQVSSVSDSTSQTKYGIQENPDKFKFDFVTHYSIADNVAAYYLAQYKVRRWVYELEAFLDNMELEYADMITIGGVTGTPVGVIIEASLTPGSETEPDGIKLLVEV